MKPVPIPFTKELFGTFLREYPLYRRLYTEPPKGLPVSLVELLPDELYFYCDSDKCNRVQPFNNSVSKYVERDIEQLIKENSERQLRSGWGSIGRDYVQRKGVYVIDYRCKVCWHNQLRWWIEIDSDLEGDFQTYIRKVGQVPPFELLIDKTLSKKLGRSDEVFFKEAQICISQSYGIGACIYLRRIIENKIDVLLQIYLEKRRTEKAEPAELESIQTAIETKVFEDKLRFVSPELPASIEVEGHNPVYLMYSKLSNGIHALNDQQCVEIAQSVSKLLTTILVNLEEQKTINQAYVDGIKALAKNPPPGLP